MSELQQPDESADKSAENPTLREEWQATTPAQRLTAGLALATIAGLGGAIGAGAAAIRNANDPVYGGIGIGMDSLCATYGQPSLKSVEQVLQNDSHCGPAAMVIAQVSDETCAAAIVRRERGGMSIVSYPGDSPDTAFTAVGEREKEKYGTYAIPPEIARTSVCADGSAGSGH